MATDVKLLRIKRMDSHDKLITYPSWQEVGAYLRRLDGKKITYIGLYNIETISETEYFLVGGGGAHYMCTYFANGEKYHLLYDDTEVAGNEDVSVRNAGELPRKYCVSFEDLYQNVKYFYEYGGMHPKYKWESR